MFEVLGLEVLGYKKLAFKGICSIFQNSKLKTQNSKLKTFNLYPCQL
jgi:hypothetical protein